jgi:hyperosmotically inducible periplasmic protein
MKISRVVELAVAASIVTVSLSAWSQTPVAASGAAIASSGPVAPAGRKADRALRRKVYAAIVKDKDINAGDISVVAKDGRVTLSGTAPDTAQIARVEAITRGVAGVTSVTNKLMVKKPFGGM